MGNLSEDYQRYRWFCTASGKTVIGGKSAVQNEQLLRTIVTSKQDYLVMHTSEPGSPFSVILADGEKITAADKEECAIFTACFSRAWRAGKTNAAVDIFSSSQLYKEKTMSVGTWGVKSKSERVLAPLRLVLTRQNGVLRAVPPQSVGKKEALIMIVPGAIDKRDFALKLELELEKSIRHEEVLAALPAGGSKLIR